MPSIHFKKAFYTFVGRFLIINTFLVTLDTTCKIPRKGEADVQNQRVQVHQPRITKENCDVPFSVHSPQK